jgi:hypothetical protein
MWRLGIEQILGIRQEDGQLRIEPCIPPGWAGFEAWVQLAEQCLHIVVENPDHVAGGIATMTLDGESVPSRRIVVTARASGTHEVRVRLGARPASASASDQEPKHPLAEERPDVVAQAYPEALPPRTALARQPETEVKP